jgi:hypothetical protein
MSVIFTAAKDRTEVEILVTPTFDEFVSGTKPLCTRDMEFRINLAAHVSADGIMDALPILVYPGKLREDGTFERALPHSNPFPAFLNGRFGDRTLKYHHVNTAMPRH